MNRIIESPIVASEMKYRMKSDSLFNVEHTHDTRTQMFQYDF